MITTQKPFELTRHLQTEQQTQALGRELALFVSPDDWIGLSGGLGAGKSTLARALIRALAQSDSQFDVPSPTFTLVQIYNELRVPVAHCDFYRLTDIAEIEELGLEDIGESHLCLAEWPDRLGDHLPANRLMIELSFAGTERSAQLVGFGRAAGELRRMQEVQRFLEANVHAAAERIWFQGDASSRRYEKLTQADGKVCLLMDMPDMPDGSPIRSGKPYSAIAHIATGIHAVIGINAELCRRGLSAPQTLASDLEGGLALIEFLDGKTYYDLIAAGKDASEYLLTAVELLAGMAAQDWPNTVVLNSDAHYVMPTFDKDAFLIETELLLDWFWPALKGAPTGEGARTSFNDLWSRLFAQIDDPCKIWMLRDFHSPNLIWLPDRKGTARVGLVDTQDALLGHAAYDLVSILQDARIDIPIDVERELLDRYCALRSTAANENSAPFDEVNFRSAYAILGAQRATKVLGIFVRLAERDGKPGYLKHTDRVSRALERNLAHPALAELKGWFDANLPQNLRKQLLADG